MEKKLTQLVDRALSRRGFIAGAGALAAGTAVAGCSNSGPATTPVAPTVTPFTDADYLNFALNLEYLEAEFYLRAATGTGLSAADTGNANSKTTGGAQVPGLTPVQTMYINEIAQNELDHVRFLRAALGASAQAAPAIDLTTSFNTLATAAGLGSAFNPFANYSNYLIGAFIFEDVGVTAYHGAAKLLTSKTYLVAAAEILAVEAYHAASIRSQIVALSQNATGTTLVSIANAVQTVRASLGGGNETTLSATGIVAADSTNSIAFERTTDQVLHIVYGNVAVGTKSGVFFPNGLNGNISVTTT